MNQTKFRIKLAELAKTTLVLGETQNVYEAHYALGTEVEEATKQLWLDKITSLTNKAQELEMLLKTYKTPALEEFALLASEKSVLNNMAKHIVKPTEMGIAYHSQWITKIRIQYRVVQILEMFINDRETINLKNLMELKEHPQAV